jgi:hypothetical protein
MTDLQTPALEMTQAEYAVHRGVSRQAVHDLIKRGKITPIEREGQKLIDVVAADRALGESRERVTVEDDAPGLAPAEGAGLTRAKTATEIYRARLAQLEYEERVGRLVPVAQLQHAAGLCAEAMIRALDLPLSRADAIAAAAAKGPSELRGVLKEIIREQRQRASDEYGRLAEGAEKIADDSGEG